MRRGIGIALATAAAALVLVPSARADHHFIKITEVFPGSFDTPDAEFVEVGMYSAGQNLLQQVDMQFYSAGGAPLIPPLELEFVPNGENQRTALVGSTAFETLASLQADIEYSTAVMSPAGGGVCVVSEAGFGTLDCVAWGSANVTDAGTSAPAIPDGSSLTRDISDNCNTLLESQDDTGSSAADFFASGVISPQLNSAQGFNSSCPNTQITKKPKPKTTDRTPRFEFSGGDSYACVLDDEEVPCDTPFEPGKLKRGKHKIEVAAHESDGSDDGTPAKYSWKIVKR